MSCETCLTKGMAFTALQCAPEMQAKTNFAGESLSPALVLTDTLAPGLLGVD